MRMDYCDTDNSESFVHLHICTASARFDAIVGGPRNPRSSILTLVATGIIIDRSRV